LELELKIANAVFRESSQNISVYISGSCGLADLNFKAQLVLKSMFDKYVVINCKTLRAVVNNAADGHLYHSKRPTTRHITCTRERSTYEATGLLYTRGYYGFGL